MPTVKDVAREEGVSPMTVSRVLNDAGNVWPGVLAMIRACNIRNHSAYHADGLLFAYSEYVGDGSRGI